MKLLSSMTDSKFRYWTFKFGRLSIFCALVLLVLSLLFFRDKAWIFGILLLLAVLGWPLLQAVAGRRCFTVKEYVKKSVLQCWPNGYELLYPFRKYLYDHHHRFMQGLLWYDRMGYRIDWDSPRDLNEKIQWLLCNSETSAWSRCADKHAVREFVRGKGLGGILLKEYGFWKTPEEIPYDSLPDKFVLKCNHDSGSTIIVDKQKGYDKQAIAAALRKALAHKPGYDYGETFYNAIEPGILAEEFLPSDDTPFSSSAIDYKVWCFDGEPFVIWAVYGRTSHECFVNDYDTDWKVHPEHSVFSRHYKDGKGAVLKPECLQEMLSAAATLSKGFPQLRADFYVSHGKLYFGEMTFTSNFGMMDFYTPEFLKEMGSRCVIPPERKG